MAFEEGGDGGVSQWCKACWRGARDYGFGQQDGWERVLLQTVFVEAVAAWAGPKVIRAIYPEDRHEDMIKMHRTMIIIAIIMLFIGIRSSPLIPLLLESLSS